MKLENIDKMQGLASSINKYALVRQKLIQELNGLNANDKNELKDAINITIMRQMERIQKEMSDL